MVVADESRTISKKVGEAVGGGDESGGDDAEDEEGG